MWGSFKHRSIFNYYIISQQSPRLLILISFPRQWLMIEYSLAPWPQTFIWVTRDWVGIYFMTFITSYYKLHLYYETFLALVSKEGFVF